MIYLFGASVGFLWGGWTGAAEGILVAVVTVFFWEGL